MNSEKITTIVGESTRISGSLEGDEDLTVRGRVEGTIRLTRTLNVETNGVVVADVDVKNAVVSGVLVGNVTASDSVHITEEGRMVGDLNAPRVIIVAGASFRGKVDMGDLDAARPEARLRAEPRTRPEERPRPPKAEEPSPAPEPSAPREPRVPSRPVTPQRVQPKSGPARLTPPSRSGGASHGSAATRSSSSKSPPSRPSSSRGSSTKRKLKKKR